MRQKRIQLISPKCDEEFDIDYRGIYKPRPLCGLEYIAASVKKISPGADIKIYDGEIVNEQQILKNMPNEGIIGLSDVVSKHRNVIKYAEIAKKSGNIVVLGGPNLNYMPSLLLEKYPFIDYIIVGSAEEAFSKLINGYPTEKIENLWYRKDGKVRFNPTKNINLNDLPLFDFSHTVDWEKYYVDSKDEWYTPIAGIRGCINATRYGKRCVFCSIPTKGVQVQNPKKYWEQVKHLKEKYNIIRFFEVGDIFSVGNYPISLAEKKSKGLEDVTFGVHESVISINKEVYKRVVKTIGISEVFLGVEHINEEIIKQNKNVFYDREKIEEVIKFLGDLNIKISLGMIFGLPGETIQTAKENYSFLKMIAEKYPQVYRTTTSIAIPHIGTNLFKLLLENPLALKDYEKKTGKKLEKDDFPHHNLLSELNIRYSCKISLEDLYEIYIEAQKILPNTHHMKIENFGKKK